MPRKIPLPRAWNRRTKAAILQILALSHYAFTAMVARAANERSRQTRLRAEIDRLNHEIAQGLGRSVRRSILTKSFDRERSPEQMLPCPSNRLHSSIHYTLD